MKSTARFLKRFTRFTALCATILALGSGSTWADTVVTNTIPWSGTVGTAASWTLDTNAIPTDTLTLAGATPTVTVNALGAGKSATISAVADSAVPPLSATQNFTGTVNSPVKPAVTNLSLDNGQISFSINGDAGPDYQVFASTNLISWSPIWTNSSSAPPFQFTDAVTNFNRRFYRVLLGA